MNYYNMRNSNLRKVSGIACTGSTHYYNNRYGRRQMQRQQQRTSKKKQKSEFYKQTNTQNNKRYKSNDTNIIYLMEAAKVKNKRIYQQLNSNKDMQPKSYSIEHKNLSIEHYNKMLQAYNKTKTNADIINFENRRKIQSNKTTNDIIDFNQRKKLHETKIKKQKLQEQQILTKKQEMVEFKRTLREQTQSKDSKLDKAINDFEIALKQKQEYDKQLTPSQYRAINRKKTIKRRNTTISNTRGNVRRQRSTIIKNIEKYKDTDIER